MNCCSKCVPMDQQHVHAAIIADLRTRLAASPFAVRIAAWNDAQLLHRTFFNYRGMRGLRLTQFGQQLMRSCFQCYEFVNKSGGAIPAAHLLFLDSHAKMPYFWDRDKLIVYDKKFAVYLRLVGGDIATLVEIDLVD